MRNGQVRRVIRAAKSACGSFAAYQHNFFDSDRQHAWRGWENWLAVDIGRLLNTKIARPFHPFPGKDGRRMDLFVDDGSSKVAVEVKVNYLDNHEINTWGPTDGLPSRVLKDRDKLAGLPRDIRRLLLVSTCFENGGDLAKYPHLVKRKLRQDFRQWQVEWHDCSSVSAKGWNYLLALSR